jgi:Ran GTPase-activating protein (RanGAP) involved in mRNA processing and transport
MLLQLLKLIFKNLKNDTITNTSALNSAILETYLYTLHSRIIYINTNLNTFNSSKAQIYMNNEDYYSTGTGLVIKQSIIDEGLLTYISQRLDKKLFLLELVGNIITQEGFDIIMKNYRTKDSLRIIKLDGNRIQKVKSQDLILKLVTKLHKIELLSIANVELSTRGRVTFLSNFRDLRSINITGLRLGLEGCKELNTYMKKFIKVTYLNLSNNDIRTKGVGVFTNSLYILKNLTHLNLSKNNICSDGVILMLPCLNERLEYLNLNDNRIDIRSISEIVAIMPTVLKNLRIFYIGGNRIGNKACLLLLNAFMEVKKLGNIDLSRNNLTVEIREKIISCLKYMKNLKFVDLRYNKIEKFGIREELSIMFS